MEHADPLQTKADDVISLCRQQHALLGTAESCTGGMLSALITSVAGASDVFWGGMVTYANKAKHEVLGVTHETLREFGAVSEQVANEMAQGIWKRYGVDAGISITGIAGPGGGTAKKPIGTVHIAACLRGKLTHRQHHFSGNRQQVREQAVEAALDLLLEGLSSPSSGV